MISEIYVTKKILRFAGCGGIIKENKGTISSPSATSKDICFWVLSAPVGYVIKITWLTFQLIHTYACNGDYVEIFDNNTETQSSTSIDKYCGSILPSSLISSSNMLTIKLRKNIYVYTYSKKEAEFILFYTFIPDDNCNTFFAIFWLSFNSLLFQCVGAILELVPV